MPSGRSRTRTRAAALAGAAGAGLCLLVVSCAGLIGRPPKGAVEELTAAEKAAIERIRSKVDGLVVWSSSRAGNHDIYLMKTDGTLVRQLTRSDHVDWYPRFSRDGRRVLFTRSKRGWVSEMEANRPHKWDLYLVDLAGGEPRRVVDSASWGIWIGDEEILYARGTRIFTRGVEGGEEKLLVDSTAVEGLSGAELQNPHLSPDRKFVAITLRGARRETGIYSLERRTWVATGQGCQINWFPSGDRIIWVNPSGNGNSEVFSVPVADGKPTRKFSYEEMRLIDIPGRQSHEYFPQLDRSGRWLVWGATRRGHDHDIADYDIFIWQVGSPAQEVARLTFHTANDRWPDIFIPGDHPAVATDAKPAGGGAR